MRTTITLTEEAESLIRRAMRDRGVSFKEAVNAAIVDGLTPAGDARRHDTPTFDLGEASVPLERALALAAELEDEELLRRRDFGR